MPATTQQTRRPASPLGDDAFLRLDDVADELGCSRITLWRLRREGIFPAPDLTIGRSPLWRVATIRALRGTLR